MTDIIFVCIAVLLIIVLFCILRKLSATIKLIIVGTLLFVACTLYIFLVPTSPASVWVTSNITARISLDKDNEYDEGETLYEYTLSSESDNTDNILQDFVVGTANSILTQRIKALAEKYIELQENYTMPFRDAYLIITPEDDNVTVEIIKGKYLEET